MTRNNLRLFAHIAAHRQHFAVMGDRDKAAPVTLGQLKAALFNRRLKRSPAIGDRSTILKELFQLGGVQLHAFDLLPFGQRVVAGIGLSIS